MTKNMIEPELESNQVQLTSNVRLQIDKLNKTLIFKRVRKEGKGPNAKDTNEYIYGNEKYFGTYEVLAKSLLKKEFTDYVNTKILKEEEKNLETFIKVVEDAKLFIEEKAKEITNSLKKQIVINLDKKGRDE